MSRERPGAKGHMNICCYYCDGKKSMDKQEGDFFVVYITYIFI